MRGPQLAKRRALEGEGGDRGQRGRLRAARPAVEHRDLAKKVAGRGDLEAQLPSLAGRGGEPYLPFGHQIDMGPRIAAGKQHCALGEMDLAKSGGADREIVGREVSEQLGAGQEPDSAVVVVRGRHARARPQCVDPIEQCPGPRGKIEAGYRARSAGRCRLSCDPRAPRTFDPWRGDDRLLPGANLGILRRRPEDAPVGRGARRDRQDQGEHGRRDGDITGPGLLG